MAKNNKKAAKPAKKAAKPAPKKAAKPAAKKTVKPAPKKAAKPLAKKTVKPAPKKVAKPVAKKTVKPAPKKAASAPLSKQKSIAKKTVKPAPKKVAKVAPKKAVKNAPKASAKAAKPLVKKGGKPVAAKPADKKKETKNAKPEVKKGAAKKETKPVKLSKEELKKVKPVGDDLDGELEMEEGILEPDMDGAAEIEDDEDVIVEEEEPKKAKKRRKDKGEGKKSYDSENFVRKQVVKIDLNRTLIKKPQTDQPKPFVNTNDNRTRYSDKELTEFRELILQKLTEAKTDYELLKQTLSHADDHGTDDTSPTFKLLEDGSDVLSKEETAQLAARQEKYIVNLQNALVRIQNKTYGICRATGKLIPKERLRSVPHATLSIDAKLNQSN
jgi:DnaK suppressor protein